MNTVSWRSRVSTTAQHCGALSNSAVVYNTKSNGPKTEPWGINAPQQMDEQRTLTIVQTDRQTDGQTSGNATNISFCARDNYAYKATRDIRPTSETPNNSIFRPSIYLLLLLYIAFSLSEGVCSSFGKQFTYMLTYLFETVYSWGYTFSIDHCCGFRRCVW